MLYDVMIPYYSKTTFDPFIYLFIKYDNNTVIFHTSKLIELWSNIHPNLINQNEMFVQLTEVSYANNPTCESGVRHMSN